MFKPNYGSKITSVDVSWYLHYLVMLGALKALLAKSRGDDRLAGRQGVSRYIRLCERLDRVSLVGGDR